MTPGFSILWHSGPQRASPGRPFKALLYTPASSSRPRLSRVPSSGHAFVDGNKRTGIDAALVFLRMNGYRIRLGAEDFVALALDIAGDKAKGKEPLALEGIAERLRAASRPIEPSF